MRNALFYLRGYELLFTRLWRFATNMELQIITSDDGSVEIVIQRVPECIRGEIFSTTKCAAKMVSGPANFSKARNGKSETKWLLCRAQLPRPDGVTHSLRITWDRMQRRAQSCIRRNCDCEGCVGFGAPDRR
jgi:hypothetical protein